MSPATLCINWVILFEVIQWTTCQTTFDCYLDKCSRGLMYCVHDRKRCYNCADRANECGSYSIPRDCDAYCANLKGYSAIQYLNSTLENLLAENRELNESNANNQDLILNQGFQLSEVLEENRRVATEANVTRKQLADVVLKLNESERERKRLDSCVVSLKTTQKHLNSTFEENVKSWQDEKSAFKDKLGKLHIGLVLVILFLMASIILNVYLCIRHNKKRKRKSYISRRKGKSEEPVPIANERSIQCSLFESTEIKQAEERNGPELNPPQKKNEKRKSQDSGINSNSESSSLVNEDVVDGVEDGRPPRNLHQPDTKTLKGPLPEIECDCDNNKGTGVRLCMCNSQISPTDGTDDAQATLLMS